MRKNYLFAVVCVVGMLAVACKKSGGGGGGGGGTKPGGGGGHTPQWLVKSIIGKYDDTKFGHLIVTYNDTGRIERIGYGLSSNRDTFDKSEQRFVNYTYDSATGRLISMKPNDAPGYKFVYISAYKIQVIPEPYYPASDGYSTLSFNAHGRNELDSRASYIPPGQIGAGTDYHNYNYNDEGAIQSENVIDDKGKETDFWAAAGSGPSKSIRGPMAGTSIEQRLACYNDIYGFLGDYDMMGDTWSNGVLEVYSYSSGTKKLASYYGENFKLNSDSLVVEIMPQQMAVGAQSWQLLSHYFITYEKH